MRNQSAMNPRQQSESAFLSPAPWQWWGTTMANTGDLNAKLHESYVAFAGEWQEFVSRRFNEDMGLVQNLAHARTPEDVWSAYVKFWQRAAEDYAQEQAILARRAGDIVNSHLMATQRTIGDVAAAMPMQSKAA